MKVVVCHSVKGGVGRTTAVVNLAHAASQVGPRVLLWDLDPQGAAGDVYRVAGLRPGTFRCWLKGGARPEDGIHGSDFVNLDVLPADPGPIPPSGGAGRRRLERFFRRSLGRLATEYDYLIVDCPPGRSVLAAVLVRLADLCLVPVADDPLSVRATVDQFAAMADEEVLRSWMPFRQHSRPLMAGGDGEAPDGALPGMPVTRIPWGDEVDAMAVRREPVGHFAADSAVARAYAMLWWEIRIRLSVLEDEAG